MGRKPLFPTFWTHFVEVPETGCWEWAGMRSDAGYGIVRDPRTGKVRGVHRVAYELHHGLSPLPPSVVIRHVVCDNPPCGNPAHLAKGTAWDNVRDAVQRDRHTRGERRPNAVLTDRDAAEIKTLVAQGHRPRAIVAVFGTPAADVAAGKSWRHVAPGPVSASRRGAVEAQQRHCRCGCGKRLQVNNLTGYAGRCHNRPLPPEPKSTHARGTPLSAGERTRILALHKTGVTALGIARITGRGYHTIRNVIAQARG